MKFVVAFSLAALVISSACTSISAIATPPTLDAYSREFLPVGSGHELYLEQSGNPSGVPIIFMHGGPGDGTSPKIKRLFNPSDFRIITFDQRGAGKSKFTDFMADNNLPALVSDIEKIRDHLHINKWIIIGGSWGSTLSIAYSEQHADHVLGLITWGNFLGKKTSLPWLNATIQTQEAPKSWAAFTQGLTPAEVLNPAAAYSKRLTDPNLTEDQKLLWAQRWKSNEQGLAHAIAIDQVEVDPLPTSEAERLDYLRGAIIETTYIANDSYQTPETDLLANASKLTAIQETIIQGDADHICPLEGSATSLHLAVPSAQFVVVHMGGHSTSGPRMEIAVRSALAELYSKVD